MTRIVVTETAQADLGRLIHTRSLPASTRDRVGASLAPLARFPELGRSLSGRWSGFRVLLGPWSWMLLVYVFDPAADLVTLVTIQDSRSATSATSRLAEPTLATARQRPAGPRDTRRRVPRRLLRKTLTSDKGSYVCVGVIAALS